MEPHMQQPPPLRERTPEENLCVLMHAGIFGSIVKHMCEEDPDLHRELENESAASASQAAGFGRVALVDEPRVPPPASRKKRKEKKKSREISNSSPSAKSSRQSSSSSSHRRPSQREELALMLRTAPPPDDGNGDVGQHQHFAVDDAGSLQTTETEPVNNNASRRQGLHVSVIPVDRNVILVAAHRATDPCLFALPPLVRGYVLLHAFEPVELGRCALEYYNICVNIPWVAHVLSANGLLLSPESLQAARNAHAMQQGVRLLLMAQVLQNACNCACRALRIPQQRFRCSLVRSALDLPLLLLYPVCMEGSAYVMGEAFKHLTHTVDLRNQQICVRIQQRLMNIHGYDLFSTLWYLVARMVQGDERVRGPQDAGQFLIEATQRAAETETRAIELIETWYEQNVVLHAFSVRPALPR